MPRTTSNNSLLSEKDALRKKTARLLAAFSPANRNSASSAAATNLKEQNYWRESRSVLGYLSFGSELSADKLLRNALAEGKYVYVPKVMGGQLDFHRIMSLDDNFSKGVFGIREPSEESPKWDFKTSPHPVLVLVPGLAFTGKGARLGRGGGYYDRFISRIRSEASAAGEQAPLCIGYAFQDQIVDSLPTSDHDEFLNGIVTDSYAGQF